MNTVFQVDWSYSSARDCIRLATRPINLEFYCDDPPFKQNPNLPNT